MSAHCRKCGRALTDPISIEKGIGSICAATEISQPELFEEEEKHHRVTGVFTGDIILHRGKDGPLVNIPQQVVYHSPTGFEWGYGGSGPADLALNILLHYTDEDTAMRLHQSFKWDFITGIPEEGATIRGDEIRSWLKQNSESTERGVMNEKYL